MLIVSPTQDKYFLPTYTKLYVFLPCFEKYYLLGTVIHKLHYRKIPFQMLSDLLFFILSAIWCSYLPNSTAYGDAKLPIYVFCRTQIKFITRDGNNTRPFSLSQDPRHLYRNGANISQLSSPVAQRSVV